eukprot:TRINITY_DN583_c0_g1_i4.p1 TRINITY_DN583_c0_g1~~TRINITY_DN583_c0_g1_i4.p1  ORF type:complete len:565 (-),score=73.53 TRINITY_DN583_c0_g1_i4:259-1878(-)
MPRAPLMHDIRISEVPLAEMACRPHFPIQGVASFPVDVSGAIKVNVRVNVMELVKIDQIQETFKAVFVLNFYYVDPRLRDFQADVKFRQDGKLAECSGRIVGCPGYDGQTCYVIQCTDGFRDIPPCDVLQMSQPDWSTQFDPSFSMMNVVGMPEQILLQRTLEYCSSEGGHVSVKYKYLAEFSERLELQDMPFDRQLLRMKFVAELPLFHLQFAPLMTDAGHLKGGKREDAPDAAPVEWKVSDKRAILQVMSLEPKDLRARFDVLIHVERKPAFYVWNTFFTLFLLTMSSMIAYLMKPAEVEGRAAVFLTLLLATVGYKFIVSTWMPIKPYLTFLDKYVISSFLFQGVSIAETIFVVWFWCRPIRDHDQNWQDGIYNGTYKLRSPPSHECSDFIDNVEFWFTKSVFAPWAIINISLLVCPRIAIRLGRRCLRLCRCVCCIAQLCKCKSRCDIGLQTWEEIYEQHKLFAAMEVPESNHPYGVRTLERTSLEQASLERASTELPDLLRAGRTSEQLNEARVKNNKKSHDSIQQRAINRTQQ